MLLKFAIKNFIEEKKLNNVSAATMERYVGTTSEFHAFCVEEKIVNVEEVTTTMIKKYFLHCSRQQITSNSPKIYYGLFICVVRLGWNNISPLHFTIDEY
ncbi:phage integrase SAM-like domain-containing protein [Paenibacillus durus]|uniref:phage integrase SAM-like domain-containing protein n=1 Tax=Paenibacillus durus TaxID=44251 RepID=UPI0009DE9848